MKSFADKDVDVIGVSGDTVKTQEAFKKFHKLTFTLLADEKGEVGKAFGVPVSKGGTAKAKVDDNDEEFIRGVTLKRWTFVLGKDGKVAYKNTEVKTPAEDSKAVLEVIAKLK
jgi:peroxiredoxin Q/BCP